MGPKKAVAPPERRKVNYDNGRNLMTRNLKNWYKTHKDYYNEFKSSIEGAFLNGDEKTVFELIGNLRKIEKMVIKYHLFGLQYQHK